MCAGEDGVRRNNHGEDIQGAVIRDPGRTTFVCEVSDRLVAYGQLRRGSAPPCVSAARPVEIQRLYVDASWLGVWERNPRAISLKIEEQDRLGINPQGVTECPAQSTKGWLREHADHVVLSPPATSGGFVHATLDGRPAARPGH